MTFENKYVNLIIKITAESILKTTNYDTFVDILDIDFVICTLNNVTFRKKIYNQK